MPRWKIAPTVCFLVVSIWCFINWYSTVTEEPSTAEDEPLERLAKRSEEEVEIVEKEKETLVARENGEKNRIEISLYKIIQVSYSQIQVCLHKRQLIE